MASKSPPKLPARQSDLDAEARFVGARKTERRRQRRRLVGVSAIACVALAAGIGFGVAGGGGGTAVAGHGSGGIGPAASSLPQRQRLTATITASSSLCSQASQPATVGDPSPGQCVIMLPNGHRYKCPVDVVNSFGANDAQATTDSACHRIAAPTIPTSWRPMIRQMHQVKACLQTAGIAAGAGVVSPVVWRAHPDTPIATLLIEGAEAQPATTKASAGPPSRRPTIVSFYLTTAQARHAYDRTISTISRQGQSVAVHARVIYTSNETTRQATAERRCVQAV